MHLEGSKSSKKTLSVQLKESICNHCFQKMNNEDEN